MASEQLSFLNEENFLLRGGMTDPTLIVSVVLAYPTDKAMQKIVFIYKKKICSHVHGAMMADGDVILIRALPSNNGERLCDGCNDFLMRLRITNSTNM